MQHSYFPPRFSSILNHWVNFHICKHKFISTLAAILQLLFFAICMGMGFRSVIARQIGKVITSLEDIKGSMFALLTKFPPIFLPFLLPVSLSSTLYCMLRLMLHGHSMPRCPMKRRCEQSS